MGSIHITNTQHGLVALQLFSGDEFARTPNGKLVLRGFPRSEGSADLHYIHILPDGNFDLRSLSEASPIDEIRGSSKPNNGTLAHYGTSHGNYMIISNRTALKVKTVAGLEISSFFFVPESIYGT